MGNSKADKSDKPPAAFNSAAWLEDFHQLLSAMSSHYANLEWAVEERKMDLPKLRAQTEARLREAKDGGIPATLKNSGAQVKMPDCIRLRADGSDEVNGITPDVLVPWADRDSEYQRASKLLIVMQQKLAPIGVRGMNKRGRF